VLFQEYERDNWYTPDWLFGILDAEFGPFTLDAAASPKNTKCEEYFTVEDDGLCQEWHGRVWCNPPYRNLIRWVTKAYEETQSGRCEIAVLLLPAQTSTDWFHDFALPFAELRWIKRKVKFGGRKTSALMPSVAAIFRRPA
jgi:phage N-6-adenine-methyltransferase